jgi:hypothetical protein
MEMPPDVAELLQGMTREEIEDLMRSMGSMQMGTGLGSNNSRTVGRAISFQDVTDDIEGRDRTNFGNPEEMISRYGLPKPSSFPKPNEVRKEAKERATVLLVCAIF